MNKRAIKKAVLARITTLMGRIGLVEIIIGNCVILKTAAANIKRQPMTINNLDTLVIPTSFPAFHSRLKDRMVY